MHYCETLTPLLENYPEVMGLYLFGSRSRGAGTARSDSDVDLAVLLAHETDAIRATA